MNVTLSKRALADLAALVRHEPKLASKALALIEECRRDPFRGMGKPEPLKHDKSGFWSRRINDEHRLVYRVVGETLEIAQCRFHY
jgi:toxin YoeB